MTADHAVPLHDVAKSSQIARLQHLEMQSRQQELELAALHSKYSEALNYLGTCCLGFCAHTATTTTTTYPAHTGECLETIENLHDDMDSMRTVMQQQSEALAQHKCSSVHINTTKQSVSKGPPSSFPHLGKSTPRHLSCDSAFEWPLNDSCHESEQGGNSCASSMTYEVQIVECSSLVECDAKPSLEQQVAKLLVGADKAVGAYHQSCFLPFLF